VYWTRRLLVLGVLLVLVVVLARVLGGSADGSDPAQQATQAGARTTATVLPGPVAGPTAPQLAGATGKKGRKGKPQPVEPPEPVLAAPSGPCDDADVVATPVITQAAGGADVPITLNLRTRVTAACTWHVSPQSLAVTITSGDDHIWSSQECPASIPVQDVVVRQAVDAPIVITWRDARRSDETCSRFADWARLGWYHVQAAALGGEATDVQFELVAPSAPVVTKTVEPQPQPQQGKQGGKKKQRDTGHQPGEDGSGNSEG
jgi:hypothetical protein